MEKNTSDYIKKLTDSVVIGGRYLYLLHDASGNIINLINPDNDRFALIIKELRETNSVSKHYDLKALKGPGMIARLPQRANFKWHPTSFEFFTLLPQTTLNTEQVEDDLFMGRIALLELAPGISATHAAYSYILADMASDRLLGFTPDFHERFKESHPAPEGMLGLPLSSFFSPTPAAFQEKMLKKRAGKYRKAYSRDFREEQPGGSEETPVGGVLTRGKEGLVWENRERLSVFITVLRELDTRKQDFSATLTFRNMTGTGPVFILGNRYVDEDRLPDNTGYLLGRAWEAPAKAILKRNGFAACGADLAGDMGTETILRIEKTGETLCLYENHRKLLAFYDSDFVHLPSAFISLGLRKGYSCVLKALDIDLKDTDAGERPKRHIAVLRNREGRSFTLDRFYNTALSAPEFMRVAGFLLNDITDMQERIASLDREVRAQLRHGEKLNELLKQYRRDEEGLVGGGSAMSVLKETARTVASSNATVLIEGETGTGKEVLARFIHDNSGRREGPFIKVDCSTIPSTLIESHLFGHEKGAFTGAASRNIGMLEKADKGTLFLDEAGNLTLEAQAKLLQFLNDFTLTRIGGTEPVRLDVRCVVASNVSLKERVRQGLFREDLYYRINVVYLRLPELKERPEDIPALCRVFLRQISAESGREITGLSPAAIKKLTEYSWPGNVRELKNIVLRATLFCRESTLSADHIVFPEHPERPGPAGGRSPYYLSLTKKEHVEEALKRNAGHATRTAKELGIARVTLYKFIRRHGINPRDFRKGLGGR